MPRFETLADKLVFGLYAPQNPTEVEFEELDLSQIAAISEEGCSISGSFKEGFLMEAETNPN
jgi:hypothetical protein